MAYGIIKVDTIIFDQGGADQNATVSGIYRAITSGVTVSGTIAGAVLIGTTTVSGTTVTGTTANFASGVFTTQVSGATVTGTQSSFTSGNFVTLSGATATFTSGVIASGTAAAPSLSILGDPNTGIYSPGADTLAFVEGGVEAMRIDAAGLVGIGTTSPSHQLDVVSASTSVAEFNGPANANIALNSDTVNLKLQCGAEAIFGSTTNHPTAFVTNNTERLRITSAGLVGIGTSSPGNLLHVESSFSGTLVKIKNNAGSTSADTALEIESSTTAAKTFLIKNSGTERFYVKGDGTSYFNGLVGIGTTSPGSALDVAGEIRIYPASGDANLRFGSGGVEKGRIAVNSSSNCIIETAGTERARIDSSGRLLVGTSTSVSNLLEGALQIVGTSVDSYITATRYSSGTDTPAGIVLGRSKSATKGTNTIVTSGDTLGAISFSGANGTSFDQAASIVAYVDGTPGASGDMPGRLVFSTTADGASAPTERMRIDALGALKTSPNGTYKFPAGTTEITHNDATSSVQLIASSTGFTGDAVTISTYRNTVNDSYKFLSCIRQGFAVALEIRDDGDVYNVNGTYGSLSDVKLKENIVDANSQWDDIRQLRVRNYNFKPETNNSTHKQIGVIAQEIEDISPGLVNTVPDRDEDGNDLGTVTKSVNYSVLYMKAVKALQEAMERIETLEARLTAAGIE